MWTKTRPVDLVTGWAQREPFQGHGGGGSRLQWVEESDLTTWKQAIGDNSLKETNLCQQGRAKR